MRPRGVKASRGYTYRMLEQCARAVRRKITCGRSPASPLGEGDLLAGLEQLDDELEYGVEDLPPGVMGKTVADPEGTVHLVLSAETYAGLERDDGRCRFTTGHEIGHVVLHRDLIEKISCMPHEEFALFRGKADHKHFEDTEWQADAFSGALLAPAEGLAELAASRGGLSANRVADHFGLSYEAADIRVRTFNSRRTELL